MVDCRECRYYKEAIIRGKVEANEEKKTLKFDLKVANDKIKELEEENLKLKGEKQAKYIQVLQSNMNFGTENKRLKNKIKELAEELKQDRHVEINLEMEDKIKKLNYKDEWLKFFVITMEECGELTQALSKYIRDDKLPKTRAVEEIEHIIEEMADVMVCVQRLKAWFDISDKELMQRMNIKLDRTMERMGIK